MPDMWFMTPALGIYTGTWYLHRHLACYARDMIFITGTRYLHRHIIIDTDIAMLYLTPTSFMLYLVLIHDMLYVICDTWYWYLPYYIWHVIPDPDTCLATHTTWHWTLILDTWHLFLTYGICYTFMWYKYLDLTSWLLTGYYHPWLPDYMTYTWLSLLRGHDMIIILLLPDIWYSWTPVLLYTWTPEIGRPLTLLLILYSCWPP